MNYEGCGDVGSGGCRMKKMWDEKCMEDIKCGWVGRGCRVWRMQSVGCG